MNTLPNPVAGTWVDSMDDWAETHQPLSEAEVDRFIADRTPLPDCSACAGRCPAPQACHQPDVCEAFPLQPLFCRYPWLGPVMVACVVIVWTCLDAYLEAQP